MSEKRLPRLCIHKAAKQYYVRINGKMIYLGSVEEPDAERKAEAERLRVLTRWQASGQASRTVPDAPTIDTLLVRYAVWYRQRYRKPSGSPTSEQEGIRKAMRVLHRLFGATVAETFSTLDLAACQEAMASGSWMSEEEKGRSRTGNWCRNVCNQMTGRIRRFFQWCVSQRLLRVEVYQALLTVHDLPRGQPIGATVPRETRKVPPAPEASIAAVKKIVTLPIATMIELQLLTGMRPGEVCSLRPCDIDTTGETLATLLGDKVDLAGVWVYLPEEHKTAHHDALRIIPLGPKAQALLAPWLKGLGKTCYVFSPKRSQSVRFEQMRQARKSKVQPSQVCRKRIAPSRQPGEHYTVMSYGHALGRACRKLGIPLFHAHQLRHNAASRLASEFGADAARTILGHASFDATKIYIQNDLGKMFEVMRKVG